MKKLVTILLIITSLAGYGQAIIIDSYVNGGSNSYATFTPTAVERGQSFTCDLAARVDSVKFKLYKVGSPTGNCYALIYAHAGTYGSSSVPTGSALATSDAVDVTSITADTTWIKFTFSGANKIRLETATYYVVTFQFAGGDASNNIAIVTDITTASHDGNRSYTPAVTSWTALANDHRFYVYGVPEVKKVAGVLATSTKKVAGVADASIKKINGKTK